ncbi:MAG: helix-turn-helix domain-containing protein, partial [Anaerolineales bacterium]
LKRNVGFTSPIRERGYTLNRTSAVSPGQFATFGDLLKHLRRQAGLTQRELSIAVGYSDAQISRLEKNERVPDAATLTARFVPALHLEHEPQWVARLLELAVEARRNEAPAPTADVSARQFPHTTSRSNSQVSLGTRRRSPQ